MLFILIYVVQNTYKFSVKNNNSCASKKQMIELFYSCSIEFSIFRRKDDTSLIDL